MHSRGSRAYQGTDVQMSDGVDFWTIKPNFLGHPRSGLCLKKLTMQTLGDWFEHKYLDGVSVSRPLNPGFNHITCLTIQIEAVSHCVNEWDWMLMSYQMMEQLVLVWPGPRELDDWYRSSSEVLPNMRLPKLHIFELHGVTINANEVQDADFLTEFIIMDNLGTLLNLTVFDCCWHE